MHLVEGVVVERWCVGRHRANAYLVYGPDCKALVVDPGSEAERLLERCGQLKLAIGAVVLTHAHFDHVGAAEAVSRFANIPVRVHRDDVRLLKQAPIYGLRIDNVRIAPITRIEHLEDCQRIVVSETVGVTAVHAPGHSPGGVCLILDRAVFTGDTLLPGGARRDDWPSASPPQLARTLEALRDRIEVDSRFFPGHGASFNSQEARDYIDRALTRSGGEAQ